MQGIVWFLFPFLFSFSNKISQTTLTLGLEMPVRQRIHFKSQFFGELMSPWRAKSQFFYIKTARFSQNHEFLVIHSQFFLINPYFITFLCNLLFLQTLDFQYPNAILPRVKHKQNAVSLLNDLGIKKPPIKEAVFQFFYIPFSYSYLDFPYDRSKFSLDATTSACQRINIL